MSFPLLIWQTEKFMGQHWKEKIFRGSIIRRLPSTPESTGAIPLYSSGRCSKVSTI